MLTKIQDHRNWPACLFAISPVASRRTARRVQNSTSMSEAPDKATTVKSSIFRYFVVRMRNTPNRNAEDAAQKAWASSLSVMELAFIAVKHTWVGAPSPCDDTCNKSGEHCNRHKRTKRAQHVVEVGFARWKIRSTPVLNPGTPSGTILCGQRRSSVRLSASWSRRGFLAMETDAANVYRNCRTSSWLPVHPASTNSARGFVADHLERYPDRPLATFASDPRKASRGLRQANVIESFNKGRYVAKLLAVGDDPNVRDVQYDFGTRGD
jgi:hypothetical protein